MNVEYAKVMVFACLTGGIEKPLAHTFTDKEGRYFISIPKPPDSHDLLGFKVRASKPHIHSNAFNYPVNCKIEPYKDMEPDNAQPIDKNYVPRQNKITANLTFNVTGQDKIYTNKIFMVPVEKDNIGLINLAKGSESDYYKQLPERVMFVEPNQPPDYEDALQKQPKVNPIKKVENASRKSEFTSTIYFFLVLSLFGILVADELKLQKINA